MAPQITSHHLVYNSRPLVKFALFWSNVKIGYKHEELYSFRVVFHISKFGNALRGYCYTERPTLPANAVPTMLESVLRGMITRRIYATVDESAEACMSTAASFAKKIRKVRGCPAFEFIHIQISLITILSRPIRMQWQPFAIKNQSSIWWKKARNCLARPGVLWDAGPGRVALAGGSC